MHDDAHLSELTLDRIAGDDAPEPPHLDRCDLCRALLVERRNERLAFATRPRPRLAAPSASRRPAVWVGLALLAALALLATRLPTPDTKTVRTKGELAWVDFEVLVKRPGDATAGALVGRGVAPGDTLQWVAAPEVDGYVAVFNEDGTGARHQVHPPAGGTDFLRRGPPRPLSSALTLDAAAGPERIVAVFCEAPFAADAVLAHLDDPSSVLPTGCRIARLVFPKQLETGPGVHP